MNSSKEVDLVKLYNRSARFRKSLWNRRRGFRSRDLAIQYNVLREDVKRFVSDPNFNRTVPRAWCFRPFLHIPIALLIVLIGIALVVWLLEVEVWSVILLLLSIGGVAVGLPVAKWLSSNQWYRASTIGEVSDRAQMLYEYLLDYIKYSPAYALEIRSEDDERLQRLQTRLEIAEETSIELEEELEATGHELELLKKAYVGLETPSQFDIPEEVLGKLSRLERTRLLEAIQAYRVNAWTPAAAVCGMILEGRLQRLCRENNIRPGGIAAMIQRLGEAGLLYSFYQNLAQVGEFFRQRSAHPTSEEFSREKTTLVLTSLVILIRDLF